MVMQIPDKVSYKDQEFILAGLKGTGLFTPMDFGISPEMVDIATACYRGYFCRYECIDKELFLVELGIFTRENIKLPFIQDVSAKSNNTHFSYESLRIPCSFSGGLILVRDPIEIAGQSFPGPLDFKEIVEILFEKGKLQQEIDHSLTVAGLRKQVDEFSDSFKSDGELSEFFRRDWTKEKASDSEMRLYREYLNEVANKMIEIEWSFVSNYEQQPPKWI